MVKVTEEAARKKLAAVCRQIISQWDSGRDWRWPTAGREGVAALKQIPLDASWKDYRSLAAAAGFLNHVFDAITNGMSAFENLSWEEALGVLEETARTLEHGKPIIDPTVLHYLPANTATGMSMMGGLLRMFKK